MKNFKSVLFLGLAMFLSISMLQVQAQKKVYLKYKLHQGDQYVTTSNTDQDIEMHVQGQVMTISQTITATQLLTVNKVEPNAIKTVQSIDKMTMHQSMGGQEFTYDSSDPSTYASGRGKQMGAAFNKVIHKNFSITIDDLGNVKSSDLKNILGDNNKLSNNVSSSNHLIIFPGKKVKVGDSWESDITPLKGSTMKIHMKYTLQKLSGKKAIIGLEGTITSNDGDTGSAMKINGTQSGEATVNTRTGWATETNLDQELKMEVNQNGMTIPMTISSTISTKSKLK